MIARPGKGRNITTAAKPLDAMPEDTPVGYDTNPVATDKPELPEQPLSEPEVCVPPELDPEVLAWLEHEESVHRSPAATAKPELLGQPLSKPEVWVQPELSPDVLAWLKRGKSVRWSTPVVSNVYVIGRLSAVQKVLMIGNMRRIPASGSTASACKEDP